MVSQDDPTSLVRVILTGAKAAVTDAAPTSPAMPSFGYRLSDRQLAAVVTYIRNSWGNSWGKSGHGTLPFAYLLSPSLASDFWAILKEK